jgi:hypothetical protein
MTNDNEAESLYPECDKMQAARDASQAIGDFLEWLQRGEAKQNVPMKRPVFLATFRIEGQDENGDTLPEAEWELGNDMMPFTYSIEKLLADYFDIDLAKVEEEKLEMLAKLAEKVPDAT